MARPPSEVAADILLNPLMIVMMAGLGFMLYLVVRMAFSTNPVTKDGSTAEGGRLVPLAATFIGVRGMPKLFAIASNSASPLLVIHATDIEYRVVRRRRRPLAEIEQIDLQTSWRTTNLVIRFTGETLTFLANVRSLPSARSALRLFPASIPMSPEAAILAAR